MLNVNTVIKHQTKCACMNYTYFTLHGLDTQKLQEEIYTVFARRNLYCRKVYFCLHKMLCLS